MPKQYKFTTTAALERARDKFSSAIANAMLECLKMQAKNQQVDVEEMQSYLEDAKGTRFYLFLRDNGFCIFTQKAWEEELKQTKKNKILQNYEMAGMTSYAEIEDF